MRPAICSTDSPVSRISRSCSVDAASSSVEVASTCCGRVGHAADRALHLRHQRAQFLDGVVDRVGDRAGDVLGHRRLLRQVAFGDRLQLVHQAQDRRLVGVVDALGFLLLAFGLEALLLRPALARWCWSRTYRRSRPAPPSHHQRRRQQQEQRPSGRRSRSRRPGAAAPSRGPCAAVRCRRRSTPAPRAPRPGPAGCRESRWPACASPRTASISAARRSRICGSRVPGRRSSALPSTRPWAISRKEFRSLPSRNTASGLTPSMVRNSLARLPMRCVSITSWPTADSSAGDASCCSFSDETVSAISSRSDDWRLIARSAWPTCGQHLLLREHGRGVLLGAVDQRQQRLERRPARWRAPRRCRRRRPSGRARCAPALSMLSRTSGKALRAADQRLRDRLGQALRLHQRLPAGADLGRRRGWPR